MTQSQTQQGHISERAIIRNLLASLTPGSSVTVPPGDDCASVHIASECELVLTSDPVIENIHFKPDASCASVGHKAVGRVLSDLAAMGAEPRWILLNIAVPQDRACKAVQEVIEGAQALASRFGAAIVGGDVSSAEMLCVNAFACGLAPTGSCISRSNAAPGDIIFVTGTLGNAQADKHLAFEPRVKEGIWLRENSFATAMIDISDGVASDLRHFIEHGTLGARIHAESIPCSSGLEQYPLREKINHALADGEDFELMFTVSPAHSDLLMKEWRQEFTIPITSIGEITTNNQNIVLVNADGTEALLKKEGFDHFEKEDI